MFVCFRFLCGFVILAFAFVGFGVFLLWFGLVCFAVMVVLFPILVSTDFVCTWWFGGGFVVWVAALLVVCLISWWGGFGFGVFVFCFSVIGCCVGFVVSSYIWCFGLSVSF